MKQNKLLEIRLKNNLIRYENKLFIASSSATVRSKSKFAQQIKKLINHDQQCP